MARTDSGDSVIIANGGKPQPTTGPPSIKLQVILPGARIAFNDATLDLDDIEAICASLLEQVRARIQVLDLAEVCGRDTSKRISIQLRSSFYKKDRNLAFRPSALLACRLARCEQLSYNAVDVQSKLDSRVDRCDSK